MNRMALVLTVCLTFFLPQFAAAQSDGGYRIGQKVEAYNVGWYKATVLAIGTGDYAGHIKVHYDDFSAASDQYLRVASIRLRKTVEVPNLTAGPRNGRYTIMSYGNIHNPLTLGYFDLNNGKYMYYDAGKNLIGKGTYSYDAAGEKVIWQSGALREYAASATFEISREGKTHTIRLMRSTIGTNSTD